MCADQCAFDAVDDARAAGRAGAVIGASAAALRDVDVPAEAPCGGASARLEPAPSADARCMLTALAEEITDDMTCAKSDAAWLLAYCAYDAMSRSGQTKVAATDGRILTAFHHTCMPDGALHA